MPYSNGTPSPGEVVEAKDHLYLIVEIGDNGILTGTDACRISPDLRHWRTGYPIHEPYLSLIHESEIR